MTNSSSPANSATVLFDGDCNLCKRAVKWAQERSESQITYIPGGSVDPSSFGLSRSDLDSAIWLISGDGRKDSGSEAVLKILKFAGQPWRSIAHLGGLPVLSSVGRIAYRLVADNRHRFDTLCRESCSTQPNSTKSSRLAR